MNNKMLWEEKDQSSKILITASSANNLAIVGIVVKRIQTKNPTANFVKSKAIGQAAARTLNRNLFANFVRNLAITKMIVPNSKIFWHKRKTNVLKSKPKRLSMMTSTCLISATTHKPISTPKK